MNSITFNDVMDFYSNHNRSIYDMIVKAQKTGGLIPFVGAGMSVFCGYKLWGGVLRELAEFIPEDGKRQVALEQIEKGTYVEAAQTILDEYPPMLDQLPALISPAKLSACSPETLKASADYALPYLFQNGLVITTNFDRVLETVYHMITDKSIPTVTPKQQDILGQLRQSQSLGLFKLHGDIGSDTVSIDDLVFTGKQYDEKYADGGPLVQELTRWFENRRLLFLGCSLNTDRTMEVLKRVTQSQNGIRHYAILGCKKSDISKRLKEMHDLGILAIFYDDSNHDAVRVILERLLEETDQGAYKKLRAASWVNSAATKEERRLLFDADYFPFTGRQLELKKLEAFCESAESTSWWAVTGPGGIGKSRLVYEFANQKRKDGWKIERFEARPSRDSAANCIENLVTWSPEVSPSIVILDDVQAHMDSVKEWLNRVVYLPRSEKLRILLLERDGKDLDSASWLGTESCDDVPEDWCYDKNFLCLKAMADADLMTIMDNFAAAAGKKLNAQLLLKTLERVDPKLKRPMYAIAIADARCQGEDPTNWNRQRVLDTLLNRELDFHFNRLRSMTGTKPSKTLCSELRELLAHSCVEFGLFIDDIDMDRYPTLAKKIVDLDMNPQEFFEGLGILRTALVCSIMCDSSGKPIGEPGKEEQRKVIALSCPDLIKEHLVLNQALENGKRDLLFPEKWEENLRQLIFLEKLLADYSERLREQSEFWDTFFQAMPREKLPARICGEILIYGEILLGYSAKYPDRAMAAVDRLAKLYDETARNPEVAEYYAYSLFNLFLTQDLSHQKETVRNLEKLYQNHPDCPEIAVQLAMGLVNLSCEQDLEGRTKSVDRLEELYRDNPECSEIAVQFACGLVNWSSDLDLEGRTKSVDRLEELYRDNPECSDIAIRLATGLVNLSSKQDLEGRSESVDRLEELYRDKPEYSDIAIQLAKGLDNLSLEQDFEGCTKTVERLEKLYDAHSDNPEFAAQLIRGWGILCGKPDSKGLPENIMQCEKLYSAHPDCEEVAKAFAACLVNIALHQKSESEVIKTLGTSRGILEKFPKNSDIQLDHAKTWFNLTLQQSESAIPATVADIAAFLGAHPNAIPPFQDALAKYLSEHPEHTVRYQPLLDLS